MLALSRKRGESIIVGEDITIVVLDIRGDKVRLGIAAPEQTKIWRTEIAPPHTEGQPDGSAV
jgi:carbon storage regulator